MNNQHDPPSGQLAAQDDDEVDGCSCNFTDQDCTPDEDLPAADGGIG